MRRPPQEKGARGSPMNTPTDFLRSKFGPLKARNLKNATEHQISIEFPRIGGRPIYSLFYDTII
jgi:hypothetical protein